MTGCGEMGKKIHGKSERIMFGTVKSALMYLSRIPVVKY